MSPVACIFRATQEEQAAVDDAADEIARQHHFVPAVNLDTPAGMC